MRRFWNDDTSARWELVLACAGLALLSWIHRARDAGAETTGPRRGDRALAVLGVLSALTFFNFGAFHFNNYVHQWDTFH